MDLIERDRILILAAPGCGKSKAIVDIALALPDVMVHVFDRQDSIMPLLVSLKRRTGSIPENLRLYRILGEPAEAWDYFEEQIQSVRAEVSPGDFICFDVAADYWDLAQEAHVWRTYGTSGAEYKGDKLVKAVQKGDKPKKVLGFGGFAPEDWSVIKAHYSMTIPQTTYSNCLANVVVTANEKTPAHWVSGDGIEVFQESNLPGQYKKYKVKPHGENTLTSSVDIVLWLKHPSDRAWTLSTIGKSRMEDADGQPFVVEDLDITGDSVWNAYNMILGRDPGLAPGKPVKKERK